MANTTPNLALPYILAAQAQKHVTHNEALRHLDALVQLSALSKHRSVPPSEPQEGDRYIVAANASGDWLDQEDVVAIYQDGVWAFHPPRPGWQVWLHDLARIEIFDGQAWKEPLPAPPQGAFTSLKTEEEELALSGDIVLATVEIPNRAIVLGVSVRVIEEVTGAASFDVGIGVEPSKFGGELGINIDDTNIGVIGPTAFYAPTPIQIKSNGGNFTGGKIQLALHYVACGLVSN